MILHFAATFNNAQHAARARRLVNNAHSAADLHRVQGGRRIDESPVEVHVARSGTRRHRRDELDVLVDQRCGDRELRGVREAADR